MRIYHARRIEAARLRRAHRALLGVAVKYKVSLNNVRCVETAAITHLQSLLFLIASDTLNLSPSPFPCSRKTSDYYNSFAMRYFAPLAVALVPFASATPLHRRDIAKFPAGTTWDIVLDARKTTLEALKKAPGSVIDIDLEDNWKGGNLTTIKELAQTKTVVCYFSAGSRENWRTDDIKFKPADYGKAMGEWPGEYWLDVKSTNVRTIMKERIEGMYRLAASQKMSWC